MTIRDYLRIIQRRWFVIVAFTAVGLMTAIVILASVPPTYTAETRVLVSLNNARTPAELEQGNNFIQARTRSYVVAARSPLVLDSVIDELGLPENPESLVRRIEAAAELNTVVITITVRDASAARAATIAESLVRNFIRTIENIEKPEENAASLVKLSLIAPATEPNSPSAPNKSVVLAVGTLAGLGLGLALTLATSRLNFRLRSVEEIGRLTELPVLGTLVFDPAPPRRPRERSSLEFSRPESYREIRNTLLASSGPANLRTILVTSSMPGEGKSRIAVDLAVSLSRVGQKVILVDANVRCPGLAAYLGLRTAPGLSDVVNGRFKTKDVLHPYGIHEVDVLASGNRVPDPAELIDSRALTGLLQDLRHNYDTVLMDGSPLSTDADAAVLSSKVDGVILIVRLGKSSSRQLKRALVLLESSGSAVLGIVVTSFPKGRHSGAFRQGTRQSVPSIERAQEQSGRST